MPSAARPHALPVTRRGGTVLFGLFLLVDLALIAVHLSMKYFAVPAEEYIFDLGRDRGYGDFFQAVKSTWLVVMLVLLAASRRRGSYAAWAVVAAYYLVDDAFLLHERVGWWAQSVVAGNPPEAVHVGELIFLISVGVVLGTVVLIAHLRAAPAERAVSRVLMLGFAVLVFFGVVFDATHHLLFTDPVFDVPFTTIEDGGELIALSAMVSFVFHTSFFSPRSSAATPVADSLGRGQTAPYPGGMSDNDTSGRPADASGSDGMTAEQKRRDQLLRAEHSTEADAAPRIEVSEHDGHVRIDVAGTAAVRPGPGPGAEDAERADRQGAAGEG